MTAYEWPAGRAGDHDDRQGRRAHRAALGLAGHRGGELRAPSAPARAGPAPAAAPSGATELWAPIGPTSSLRGQPADDGRVSGRVVDIAFEPTTGRRGYAASASGGVWFTDDAGSSWRSLGGWMPGPTTAGSFLVNPLSCGALLVEFPNAGNAGQDVVWVGTGEPEGLVTTTGEPGGRLPGIGVLRGLGPALKPATDNTAFVLEATNLSGTACFRMAHAPGGSVVVATGIGLVERPAGAGPHAIWNRVGGHPMTAPAAPATPEPMRCIDVVATPAIGATTPARLWGVFLDDSNTVEVHFRDAGSPTFTAVALLDAPTGVPMTPTGRAAIAAGRDGRIVWVLGQGPRVFRIDATAANPVGLRIRDTPPIWAAAAASTKIAIAVDPSDPTRVAVGGTFKPGAPDAAGLYLGAVTPSGTTFRYPSVATSFCGDFVHPDVMAIRFSLDGSTVWVATDGGVYRSTARGANGTFVARNDGLAVLECGYIACHPENDGGVVIGLQDNGTQRRIGETAWRQDAWGDGGGLAFDVTTPHRYVAQNTDTHWSNGLGSPLRPVRRTGHPAATWKTEDDASAFYSAPSTIARDATTTQLAIGTNRVWYTQDWGTTWRTLPQGRNTNVDARANAASINNALDVLPGGFIRRCRWETPDRLWVMTSSALFHYQRDAAGQWAQAQLAVNPVLSRRGKKGRIVGDTPAAGPFAQSGTWLDVAIHRPTTAVGALGTLYLATTGVAAAADSDQLFWFDGAATWRSAGLRSLTTAAALAVAVEPGHEEFVYVGTTIGVFRGRLEMDGTTPRWTWKRLDNGLPDVAVHDLSIHSRNGVRLLRAATQSRGVWELDLAGAVAPRTYLRVHEYDTRRRLPTALGQPFVAKVPNPAAPATLVPVDYPWHASPDVRVHPRLQVVAAPPSLTWTGAAGKHPTPAANPTGTWRLWQFQAALRALQARVEPNGTWPTRFDAVLRSAGAPLSGGRRAVTTAFWNTVMTAANVAALPWDAPRPSEADLIEWLPNIGDTLAADGPSCAVPSGPVTVQVVLHDRGFPVTPIDKVRVALLRFAFGPYAAQTSGTWAPGNVGWTAAITAFLTSGTAPTLPAGWTLVAATAASRPLAPVAAGEPQVVSFDLDLVNAGHLSLLVAVVWSEKDPVTMVEAPLRTLTLANHHVAVRSVRVLPA